VRSNAGSTSFRVRALTDLLGKHPSAVWRTADGSNAKSRQVLKLSTCYYDHGPAAYEVAHIRSTLCLVSISDVGPVPPRSGAAASGQLSGVHRRGANGFRKAAQDPELTIGATYLVTDCRTFSFPNTGSVTIPAIEPTPNPAALRPGSPHT
jgi:hypothetical protein